MYQEFIQEKRNYFILLFWMLVGIFAGPMVYLIIPIHMLILKSKGEFLWLLIGLWVILTFSDSRQFIFKFTQSFKPVMMVVLAFLYFTFPKENERFGFFKPFIPFFAIAILAMFNDHPQIFTSFQKTLSYILLLMVVPGIVKLLLQYERDRFLFTLIMTGLLILGIGLMLRFLYPGFVIFRGERFSGLLGNPNGLGIYSFCFFILFTVINYFHRDLFTKKQTWFIYGLILISLILCGSRGGLFSTFIFLIGWPLIKRNVLFGSVILTLFFLFWQVVMHNFAEIVTLLGLQDYFRLDTLETGSGRMVAREFGWMHIKENFWWGKGFAYAEYLLATNQDYFITRGHQGNLHNSYLTVWLDTGLIGLILFCFGWLINFIKASRMSLMVLPILFGMILSTSVESWLSASLNPFTIQLVIILSLMGDENFYIKTVEEIPLCPNDVKSPQDN